MNAAPALADLLVQAGKATLGGTVNGHKFVVMDGFSETIACSATYWNYRRFETFGRVIPQH